MFEYFPSNYPWSVNIALAAAQGGQLSEIDAACHELKTLGAETPHPEATDAWFQSWTTLGSRLEEMGTENEARGRRLRGSSP